jgi:excisionase family DNA binding protein
MITKVEKQSARTLRDSNLMTIKEVAEHLRMPVQSIYYHVHRGNIATVKLGGRWRVMRDRLDDEFCKYAAYSSSKKRNKKSVNQALVALIVDQVIQVLDARERQNTIIK